jgi:hypothetical protein
VLGETLRDRAGLWSRPAREFTGAVAMGVLGCALAAQLPARPLPLVVAVVVLSVTAAILGRVSMRWICVALTSAALGVAVRDCPVRVTNLLGHRHPGQPESWCGPCLARLPAVAGAPGFGSANFKQRDLQAIKRLKPCNDLDKHLGSRKARH